MKSIFGLMMLAVMVWGCYSSPADLDAQELELFRAARKKPPINGSSTDGPGSNDGGGGRPPYHAICEIFDQTDFDHVYGNFCEGRHRYITLTNTGDIPYWIKITQLKDDNGVYNISRWSVECETIPDVDEWHKIQAFGGKLIIFPYFDERPLEYDKTDINVGFEWREDLSDPIEGPVTRLAKEFLVCPQ